MFPVHGNACCIECINRVLYLIQGRCGCGWRCSRQMVCRPFVARGEVTKVPGDSDDGEDTTEHDIEVYEKNVDGDIEAESTFLYRFCSIKLFQFVIFLKISMSAIWLDVWVDEVGRLIDEKIACVEKECTQEKLHCGPEKARREDVQTA